MGRRGVREGWAGWVARVRTCQRGCRSCRPRGEGGTGDHRDQRSAVLSRVRVLTACETLLGLQEKDAGRQECCALPEEDRLDRGACFRQQIALSPCRRCPAAARATRSSAGRLRTGRVCPSSGTRAGPAEPPVSASARPQLGVACKPLGCSSAGNRTTLLTTCVSVVARAEVR